MSRHYIEGDTAVNIADSVELALHAGRVQPGDALPTVRDLAASLHVSPTTVAAAYKLLQTRGLASGSGRRGTRLRPRPPAPIATSRPRVPAGAVDLASGNPDPEFLPSLHGALRTVDPAPRLYDGPALLPALSAFVAEELRSDGVPADELTIAAGGLDGIERVLREHLRPGDRVAVEDPSFPGVLDLVAANGYAPVGVAVDDDGPEPASLQAALDARVRAVIVTPRAQNPTGAALSAGRAGALRRLLAAAPDVLLVEDDHAGPVAGASLHTLIDPGRARWAFVRSVSKFLGPDLRVAFVAGDATTVARVEGRLAVGARWVSHILQQLVLALWSDPSSARQLARAAETYRHRREALLAALEARGLRASGRSGLNVWLPVREEAATVQALGERGWAVMPGERFRLRAAPAIRVTAAALPARDAGHFAADLAAVLGRPSAGSLG